jgi:uncharacterized protein YdhG (YjbR/CyaY superfamily)
MTFYKKNLPKTIDEYLATQTKSTQKILQELREFIQSLAPEATEAMSYGVPTFKLNGNLVHFAGYEHHIGLYPGSKAMQVFKKEMKAYKSSKGAVQFPLDQALPLELIQKIVHYRRATNLKKVDKSSALR